MKNTKKMLAVLLSLVFMLFSLSCTPVKPDEKKLDRSYPDDIIPVYDDAIIYDYTNDDDTQHEVYAGTKDSVSDVAQYYSDYFEDEDIDLYSESRNYSLYAAKGSFEGWEFEISVEEPTSSSDKRLYGAMVEIYVESTGGSIDTTISAIDISSDRNTKDILNAMQNDLQIIQDLVDESGSNEDMTMDEMLTMFSKYLEQIDNKITEIKSRQVSETQLIRLQNSEIVLFEMLGDLLSEVELMIYYAIDLAEISYNLDVSMQGIGSGSDYETQTTIRTALSQTIEGLSAVTTPTFMEFKHNQIIEKLNDFLIIASDSIWAYSIEDNLRISSYNYFLDLHLRYLDNFVYGIDDDLTTRLTKFGEDIDFIKEWKSDLDYFITGTLNSETLDLSLYKSEYLSITENLKVSCNYTVPDDLIPANYRSMEYLAFIELWTNRGTADVMVTVEIPEYTQQYKQRVTVESAETELGILPPLVADINEKLNTSKDSYVEITVENIETGEIILQVAEPILVNSIYDMRWLGPDELDYLVDILAWVTPENDMVLQMQRHAADSVEMLTGGAIDGIWGYQDVAPSLTKEEITYYQTAALMHAMADAMNVKYINSSFSTTDRTIQRISTPARVLENASGLCIETAVTLASALEASRMNSMVLLLPTHAQVAVETWRGSGEYYLVETTALTSSKNKNFDNVIWYYTQEQWQQYIYQNQVIAIDCYMAELLEIHPIE